MDKDKKTEKKTAKDTAKAVEKTKSADKTTGKTAGEKKKKKRLSAKSIFLRILLGIGIVIAMLIVAVAGLIIGALYGYVEDTDLVDVENMRLNLTSFVYIKDAETGEMVEYEQLYDNENRIWVPSSEIPDHLKNAFVSIEDERFYNHSGIDYKRFLGAAFEYVSSDGGSSYGGSTITQQLIKNITRDDDYSIKRKIQEAYRAYMLEQELSKDEILEYYLNTIYLSQKCNGVGSAALTYFGKDVSELSLAESASIAGITQFPTKYDPFVDKESNRKRQLIILKKMRELGFITQKEYEAAKEEKLVFAKKPSEKDKKYQTYFVDAVIDQVIEDLMNEYNYTKEYASKILYNGGLKIYLSMDPKIQEAMDSIYENPDEFVKHSGEVQPQSSMVIMDPYTGQIKALTGGRGEKKGNRTLNRATQTLRQPGSTIKPISVYAPAIEYGLVTPYSGVKDAPYTVDGFTPRNDGGGYMGAITVATALRYSRNIPCVKICNHLTTKAAFNYMKNIFHVDTLVEMRKTKDRNYTDVGLAPIALGGLTDGVTVLDMCAAYCAFPNGGKYIRPTTYTKVFDAEGNILLEHKAKKEIALSETTAENMVKMMRAVVTGGTGTAAQLDHVRAAGKTGTTTSNKDRWFIGYTPYYVGAVWYGFDQPTPLYGYGANPAAVIWRKVMNKVHEDLPDKEFFKEDADGKYDYMICKDSGMRVTPACKNLICKTFEEGDAPTKRCTEHKYDYNRNDLGSGKATEKNKKEEEEEKIIDAPVNPSGPEAPMLPSAPSESTNPSEPSLPVPPEVPTAPEAPSLPTPPAPQPPAPQPPAPPSEPSGTSGIVDGI